MVVEPSIPRRIERATHAITPVYGIAPEREDFVDNIVDLITDLLHLAARDTDPQSDDEMQNTESVIDTILRRVRMHFDTESQEASLYPY